MQRGKLVNSCNYLAVSQKLASEDRDVAWYSGLDHPCSAINMIVSNLDATIAQLHSVKPKPSLFISKQKAKTLSRKYTIIL